MSISQLFETRANLRSEVTRCGLMIDQYDQLILEMAEKVHSDAEFNALSDELFIRMLEVAIERDCGRVSNKFVEYTHRANRLERLNMASPKTSLTPLQCALLAGNIHLATILVEIGKVSVEGVDGNESCIPRSYGIYKQDDYMVRNEDRANNSYYNPLAIAIREDMFSMVPKLLERGAIVTQSIFDIAIIAGDDNVIQHLLNRMSNDARREIFSAAAHTGSTKKIKLIVKQYLVKNDFANLYSDLMSLLNNNNSQAFFSFKRIDEKSNILSVVKLVKEEIVNKIYSSDGREAEDMITRVLEDPTDPICKILHIQRGVKQCSYDSGVLKEISEMRYPKI